MAKELFNRKKELSPSSIDNIAKGTLSTPKWFVACAVEILLKENPDALRKGLSIDDLFMLWAKPLLEHGHDHEMLTDRVPVDGYSELIEKIRAYTAANR